MALASGSVPRNPGEGRAMCAALDAEIGRVLPDGRLGIAETDMNLGEIDTEADRWCGIRTIPNPHFDLIIAIEL